MIAAGPSIHRHDPIAAIKNSGYRGAIAIVATESAMVYCLRNGVVPDLVVTVDPHDRDKALVRRPGPFAGRSDADDYYRRQDMDESVRREREFNEEVIARNLTGTGRISVSWVSTTAGRMSSGAASIPVCRFTGGSDADVRY